MKHSTHQSFPLLRWSMYVLLFSCCNVSLAATTDTQKASVGSGQLRTYSNEKSNSRHIQQATLLATEATIDTNAISTSVTLKQTFKNNSEQWVEGVYVFPLPENAAVDAMTMEIGDKKIVGKIRTKKKAKKIYQAAVKNGQKAALIEQSRDNLFTAKAGNIPPKSEVSITLHYVQSTHYQSGKFSFRLPTTYTPKFIVRNDDKSSSEATDDVTKTPENSTQETQVNNLTTTVSTTDSLPTPAFTRKHVNPININVTLDAGHTLTSISSSSHTVQTFRNTDNRSATISLQQKTVAMDKDFVLEWTIEKSEQPLALAFSESSNNNHFTSLLFIPPTLTKAKSMPRETVFIIDTSGSMSGAAIRQAKAGAIAALTYLREGDAFNIVAFNSDYSLLFSNSKMVNGATIDQAKDYINNLAPGGGTNMSEPLERVLNQKPLSEHFRQVVFLTDGAVNNEKALFTLIHQKLGKTRLFTIGIGSAPNSFFMTQSAKFGRGTFTYISEIGEVSEKISALFAQLQFPQLTDINIALSQQSTAEIYPTPLRDLYLGEPVVAHIKTPHALINQEITVSGKTPSEIGKPAKIWLSKTYVKSSTVTNEANNLAASGNETNTTNNNLRKNSGLDKLWAREKIDNLKTLNIVSGDFNRHNADIKQLGLDYQLVTSQTSFVAVEEKISRDTLTESLHKKSIANQMPAGNTMSFPTTSTSSTLTALLGSLLLVAATLLALTSRYRREFSPNIDNTAEGNHA